MAVFTPVSPEAASTLLHKLNLGGLVALRGIAGGIENTNYFVTCTAGEFARTFAWGALHKTLSIRSLGR